MSLRGDVIINKYEVMFPLIFSRHKIIKFVINKIDYIIEINKLYYLMPINWH